MRERAARVAAFVAAHNPAGEADVSPLSPHRRRLAYDELLAQQLSQLQAQRERETGKRGFGVAVARAEGFFRFGQGLARQPRPLSTLALATATARPNTVGGHAGAAVLDP